SEHHFFSRNSSLGGAAVSLEVLQKLGIKAFISDSKLDFSEEKTDVNPTLAHRYILISDGQVSYLSPSKFKKTTFSSPSETVDYLFIDRSANLDSETRSKIIAYLELSTKTKLVLYVKNFENDNLNKLLKRADLIFHENNGDVSEKLYAPEFAEIKPEKIVTISENKLSYLNITENISIERVDMLTHLSAYSIAAATILGNFILGSSVEESLKLARLNVENSRLDAVLPLEKLKSLNENTDRSESLELIAANLLLKPKGILAADESGGSIKKKFEKLNIEDTPENRRDYRNILLSAPDLEKYVNGVILFDETARQTADNGQDFVNFLISRRIIPGIKVDQGLEKFPDSLETWTRGLEGLPERLEEYHNLGLRFAKWRAAFELKINTSGQILTPTDEAINENCRILAEYTKACQSAGLVPIVEPEVVYDGYYPIEKNAEITGKILDTLFEKLKEYGVKLPACILKVNMILAGKYFETKSTPEEVGRSTANILKEHVPETLAGVVLLSGGQTPKQATENLAEIIKNGPFPWPVTFSFARALQDPALNAWNGDNKNAEKAKSAFLERLIANQKAL
ncbi:fructose-bisphosphate aldolase class I, partial [Candidatus Saccharibacteria bacterium]|nr:fructose-bisphosphate aldolase class I [Candidatus Saccharibacteria bacterium]